MIKIRFQMYVTKIGRTTAVPVMDMSRHSLRQLRGRLYNLQRKGDDSHATELQLHAVNSTLKHKFNEVTRSNK